MTETDRYCERQRHRQWEMEIEKIQRETEVKDANLRIEELDGVWSRVNDPCCSSTSDTLQKTLSLIRNRFHALRVLRISVPCRAALGVFFVAGFLLLSWAIDYSNCSWSSASFLWPALSLPCFLRHLSDPSPSTISPPLCFAGGILFLSVHAFSLSF